MKIELIDDMIRQLTYERDKLDAVVDVEQEMSDLPDYVDPQTGATITGRKTSKGVSMQRSGLSETQKADVKTAQEIDAIVASLRKLKDRLSDEGHDDPDEMDLLPRLEQRVMSGQVGTMYSPWSSGKSGEPDSGRWDKATLQQVYGSLDAKGRRDLAHEQVKSLREQARDHRRQMNASIAQAVKRYQDSVEKNLKEDRETPQVHFQRLHRELKVEAQALIYNYKGCPPDGTRISQQDLKWFGMKIREELKSRIRVQEPLPAPAIQKLWGNTIKANAAVKKVSEELEKLRKDMLVIPLILAAYTNKSSPVDLALVKKRIESAKAVPPLHSRLFYEKLVAKHDEFVAGIIEQPGYDSSILHYPGDYVKHDVAGVISYEVYQPVPETRSITSVTMSEGSIVARPSSGGSDPFKKYFFSKKPDAYIATLNQIARMVERQCHGQAAPHALTDTVRDAMVLEAAEAAKRTRELLSALHRTKDKRDNANRVSKEIRTLDDSAKIIKEQVKKWDAQMEFLRSQYRLLHDLDPANDSAFKEGVAAVVGTMLRSEQGVDLMDRQLLYKLLTTSTSAQYKVLLAPYSADMKFGTGRVLREEEWAGYWLHWVFSRKKNKRGYDQLEAFRTRLGAADAVKFKKLRATAYFMCEQYLLELSYLTEFADEDVRARAERNWVQYSRDLEQLVRRANGLIIYIEKFEGSYNKIKWVVGRLLKDLAANDYPTIGEVAVSISVGLGVGVDTGIASASAAIALQITGTLCHEDDRRVRFKGAFSINVKAEASVGTPAISSGGDESEDHKEFSANWAGIKAGVSADKGLLSATRVWTYTDHEHLAASWGHKVALVKTHLYRPIAWIKHPFDPSSGVEVINVRDVKEEEDHVLSLVVGDDTELQKVIAQIRKPVMSGFSWWQGVTNWGDLQVAGDVTANVLVAGVAPHVERMTHTQLATHFWKESYEDGALHVMNWARKQQPGDEKAPVKCFDALTDSWGKSYPPMVSGAIEGALTQYTAPLDENGVFDATGEGENSNIFNLGYTKDVAVSYDIEFGLTRWEPNPDRNGFSLAISAVRGHHVSMGIGEQFGATFDMTTARNVNPHEVRFLLHALGELDLVLSQGCTVKSDVVDFKDPGEGAKAIVEHVMGGDTLGDPGLAGKVAKKLLPGKLRKELFRRRQIFKKLTSFGKVDLGLGYSDDTTPPRWILENVRIWRSYDVGMSGKIPLGETPFYVEISGSVSRSFVVCEVVGAKGLGYLQGVFNGLAYRLPPDEQAKVPARWRFWQQFRETHKPELYDLCRNVALAPAPRVPALPATPVVDPGFAALPCNYELQEDVDGGLSNAAAFMTACTMTGASTHSADKTYTFTPTVPPARTVGVATGTLNTLDTKSCAAVGVVFFNRLTGEFSRWFPCKAPTVQGQTTPPAQVMPKDKDQRADNVFYLNPRGLYEMLALVEDPQNTTKITLTMAPGGWTKDLADTDKQQDAPPPEKSKLRTVLDAGLEFLDLKHPMFEDNAQLSKYVVNLKGKDAYKNVAVYHVPLAKDIFDKVELTKLTRLGLKVEYDKNAVKCAREEAWTYCYSLGKCIDEVSNAAVPTVELDPLLEKLEAYMKAKWQEADDRPLHWIDASGKAKTPVVEVDPDEDAGEIGVLEFDPTNLTSVATKYKHLVLFYDKGVDATEKPSVFLSNAGLCTTVEFSGASLPAQTSNAAFSSIAPNTHYNSIMVYGSKRDVAAGQTLIGSKGELLQYQGWMDFADHVNMLKKLNITTDALILDFSYSLLFMQYFESIITKAGMVLGNTTKAKHYYFKHYFSRIQAIESSSTATDTDVKNVWWDCFKGAADEYRVTFPKANGVPCSVYRPVSNKVYRSDKGSTKGYLELAFPTLKTVWASTEKAIAGFEKPPLVKNCNNYWYIKKLEAGLEAKKFK